MIKLQGGLEMPLKESELSKMPVISAEHVLRFVIHVIIIHVMPISLVSHQNQQWHHFQCHNFQCLSLTTNFAYDFKTKILSNFTLHYLPLSYLHLSVQVKPGDRRLPLPPWGERVRDRLHEVQDPRHHFLHHPLRDCKARQFGGGWGRGGRWGGCWPECRKIR